MRNAKKLRDYDPMEVDHAKSAYKVFSSALIVQGVRIDDPTWEHLSAEKRVAWIEAVAEAHSDAMEEEGYIIDKMYRWPREWL